MKLLRNAHVPHFSTEHKYLYVFFKVTDIIMNNVQCFRLANNFTHFKNKELDAGRIFLPI